MWLRESSGVVQEEFLGVRVLRDDLEQITEILNEAGLMVEYSDVTYRYDSLEEVQTKRGWHPGALALDARLRDSSVYRVSVTFSGAKASLYCFLPEPLGAVPHRLKNLLHARSSSLVFVLDPAIWVALFPIGWFLKASGWSFERNGRDAWSFAALFAAAVVLIASAVRFGYAGVWLRRRHEGNFLRRNADQFWLVIAGAVLGALATKAADRLLGK